MMVAEVVVDISNSEVDKVFDYAIPENLDIKAGMRVAVNFAGRKIEGFVMKVKESSDFDKLKEISFVLDDEVLIVPELMEMISFMRSRYHLRYADILRIYVPSALRSGKVAPKILTYLEKGVDYTPSKRAVKQIQALEYVGDKRILSCELKEKFGSSAIKSLLDTGALKKTEMRSMRSLDIESVQDKKVSLLPSQQKAVDSVLQGEGTFLLHGVTGSGKTEVYMHLISETVKSGKSAIMLVPEISLTPQIFKLFKSRFGQSVAIIHSGLTEGQRFDEWQRIFSGDAKVVIGARSAIFAPVQNTGIIIIDEEHDGSYVSESNPRYDTFGVASQRAMLSNAKLLLGSATPSISTYTLAKNGKINYLSMPERVNGKRLPEMQIVDMSRELREGNRGVFSRQLIQSLTECMESGKQAILFINRRGFSSFLMCRECGYVPKCTDCDVTLTYHKEENVMKCHYCAKRYKALDVCPNCGSKTIRQGRPGTEQIVSELQKLFPDVGIVRMDNDTVSGKDSHHKILSSFSEGKARILVGTQMIAKGHDFPNVTLVGILDADLSLYLSDYMSTERTFQLITQVAGRAGRASDTGKVVLQTYTPKHYVYRYCSNYDYDGFFEKEANLRLVSKYPPYSKIVRLMFTSEDEEKARESAKEGYKNLKAYQSQNQAEFIYLGAMKSPIKKIQKKFRYQIIARLNLTPNTDKVMSETYKIMDNARKSGVSVFAEINPSNMS
ncbi:MAG: primosomal protein N' [Clostridia bacterium]|nr:primosomal protein N' [Clostridia bacterium]